VSVAIAQAKLSINSCFIQVKSFHQILDEAN